jgi:hypothetical protein
MSQMVLVALAPTLPSGSPREQHQPNPYHHRHEHGAVDRPSHMSDPPLIFHLGPDRNVARTTAAPSEVNA